MKRLVAAFVVLGLAAAPAAAATKQNAAQTAQPAKSMKKNAKAKMSWRAMMVQH